MLLEDVVFLGRQLAGLPEDRIGDADLADVVEEPGEMDRPHQVRIEPDAFCEKHRVASDVFGVALGVAILRVDRQHESLEDVESRGRWRAVVGPGHAGRVTAARLCLGDRARRGRQQHRHGIAVRGVRAEPGAHRDRKPVGGVELEAEVDERRPQALDGRLEVGDDERVRDEEELVGAVTAHDDRWRNVPPQEIDDGQEDIVARAMAVVVVEEPEVVDIDEGDAQRRPRRPRALDLASQMPDERAMVERACERIANGRFEQRGRLAGQPALGGTEDEEEQAGRDEPGRERDEDDVATEVRQAGEDRNRVPPDCQHPHHPAAREQREVLLQDRRRVERPRTGFRSVRGDDGRLRLLVAQGFSERRAGGHRMAAELGHVGGEDAAVQKPQLDSDDLAVPEQLPQLVLDPAELVRARPAGRSVEVTELDVGVDERPGGRRVTPDDVVQRRDGRAGGDDDTLGGRGDADERQEDAVHEDQQDGAADPQLRTEHGSVLPHRSKVAWTPRERTCERARPGMGRTSQWQRPNAWCAGAPAAPAARQGRFAVVSGVRSLPSNPSHARTGRVG